MATTIVWGAASGGTINVPFSGYCSLSGTRIINAGQANDDIALAFNEYVPDATTIALWHMNEAAWSGVAGEVTDATGNGHDATAYGAATTDAEWLDRFGLMPSADGSDYWLTGPSAAWNLQELFLAGWARFDAQATSYGAHARILTVGEWNTASAPAALTLGAFVLNGVMEAGVRETAGATTTYVTGGTLTFGAWTHIAVWLTGGTLYLYQDGALVGTITGIGNIAWTGNECAFSGVAHYTGGVLYGRFVGAVDDLFVATTNPWGGEFSPHRYEPGAVVASYTLSTSYKLTTIDWSATVGASYGQITKVEVYAGGSWQTVAQDALGLTPPITGLNYTVSGPDLVRLTLSPKQDTLQSETPILDWLSVTLESLALPPTLQAGILPKRLTGEPIGPRLKGRPVGRRIDGKPADAL